MFRGTILAALLVSACGGGSDEPSSSEREVARSDEPSPSEREVAPPCVVGGCSGEGCSDHPGPDTTCVWRPEYACFRSARCEPQPDGACGWTPTPALLACLEAPPPTE